MITSPRNRKVNVRTAQERTVWGRKETRSGASKCKKKGRTRRLAQGRRRSRRG